MCPFYDANEVLQVLSQGLDIPTEFVVQPIWKPSVLLWREGASTLWMR